MRPPDSWSKARLTLAILAVTVAAWFLAVTLQREEWVAYWGGFIPARLAYGDGGMAFAPFWLTPLTATLIHAGWVHLLFNMLMLVVCGRPVEWITGPWGLGILYIVGAYAAAVGQYLVGPSSAVPVVGASGAISAVLGAYALLFGRNKVKLRNPRLAIALNALWLLAAWIGLNLVMQLVAARGAIPFTGESVQIAIAAHIGGFLVGILLAWPLVFMRERSADRRRPKKDWGPN
jgi:membrane associated rhomboid family serine protease